MSGGRARAQAVILASHLHGNTTSRDFHGVDWEHRTYILEVRPVGEEPFRVEATAKVPIRSKPEQGARLCPACGGKVDQSTAPFEESPACGLCGKPLPCQAP